MRLLVDSNALLWLLLAPDKLTSPARQALHSAESHLFMSVATVWELEIKSSKGKLHLPVDWVESGREHGLTSLPIHASEAAASARLPWHHGDPFDRMIVSHALTHGLTLVTRDTFLAIYGVKIIAA